MAESAGSACKSGTQSEGKITCVEIYTPRGAICDSKTAQHDVAQHSVAQHWMTLHIPAYCRAQHLPAVA